jgi:hypothetical protein
MAGCQDDILERIPLMLPILFGLINNVFE